MGGTPLTALNILCWDEELPTEMLSEILRGGLDKTLEAGAILCGGHSVKDDEVKYGLSVTGLVHPDRIWRNQGSVPGDVLVLTKAIGTGVVTTAMKFDGCPEEVSKAAIAAMSSLNRAARDAAVDLDVHACTDITGYGLAGHAWEMAAASNVAFVFDMKSIPLLPGALELAQRSGFLTRGDRSNRTYVGRLEFEGLSGPLQSLAVDPQTSGGLLFALPARDAARLVSAKVGVVVGEVKPGPAEIRFRG
jgi:selenide,water dikinase